MINSLFKRDGSRTQSLVRCLFTASLVALGMGAVGCGQNHHKERLATGSHRSIDLASATNEINLGTNDVIVEAAGAQIDLSGSRLARPKDP